MQTSDFWTRITSLYGFQLSSVVLCVENSDFRTKIACLYGSKTSPVILCMQNSVPSIRITSLYGSQLSSVVFGCKTATLGPDLQVCMGPRPHLWLWAHITACFAQEKNRQSGFQPSPVVLCMQTATLALELLVSIVPCPHLRFLHANQRLLDQNYKSLCVQDLTCHFVHA